MIFPAALTGLSKILKRLLVIKLKKIAVINDLSGFGKCSLSAAMPIISASGIQCCPLTTGVFSNQTGYESYKSVDFTEYLPSFIEQWRLLNPEFEAILTGFIPNSRQGKIISDFIKEFKTENTLVVVDPVMGDDGLIYRCYDDESLKAVGELVKSADVITPNLTELCILCGREYDRVAALEKDDMLKEIFQMASSLGKTVITTGIKFDGMVANAVYADGGFDIVAAQMLGGGFSGTGDILSSIITSRLVNGDSCLNAVKVATRFIETAIKLTLDNKDDRFNPADGICFEPLLKEL